MTVSQFETLLGGHLGSIIAAFTLTCLCCYPIAAFALRGWSIKRDDILGSFTTDAKALYLATFLQVDSEQPAVASKQPDKDFDDLYHKRYGRWRLVLPTLLLITVCLPLTFLIAESALARFVLSKSGSAVTFAQAGVSNHYITLPRVALAAIAGAFVWVVADLIAKYARYDLRPQDLLNATLRLAAAAPLGYAVASINPANGPFIAFAIGAFPLDAINVLLKRLANSKLNLDIGVGGGQPGQITKLDGIDSSIADRLQEEGITTVAQLAYCDSVQLCMRTGLLFDFVVDIVGQALAWIYLQDKLNDLRAGGLRSALEIRDMMEDLSKPDETQANAAKALLQSLAATVKMDAAQFQNACDQIAEDPYTKFLYKVW